VGVEALARWHDAELGDIAPGEFIPIAEETGLIVELGEQVLRKSLIDALPWANISVSVNVSAQQIQRVNMVETVERLLREYRFPASRLEIELTESVLVADDARADTQIRGLQKLGVKVALDDFGTGYASLLYLRQFGFDKLKIDRQFVMDSDTSVEARAMVISITSMSRTLGLDVTAEGVENAAQHEFLRIAGCDRLQGYLFSRPITPTQISAFIHDRRAAAA
jgi:EAL domain-containing protein (putative c-di-GMP-specific phosphodiesterase class I)